MVYTLHKRILVFPPHGNSYRRPFIVHVQLVLLSQED